MGKLVVALSLDVGLCFFFAVNAIALLRGASIGTAMQRGLAALALFGLLGLAAALAIRLKKATATPPEPEVEAGGEGGVVTEAMAEN